MCPTEHLWLWDLSIGLHEDQWCNWMTTKAQLYPPLLLWNNVPTIINCGISDGVQAVSKLISSRNNCTSTNHTGSLMSTAELPPVSCGSTREVISLCPAFLGTGGSWWYGVKFHSLWPSIHLPTCLSLLCLGQAAKTLLLLIILFGSANRWSSRFCYELPQNWYDTALSCIGGPGIYMVP